jgi:hypothetical protein
MEVMRDGKVTAQLKDERLAKDDKLRKYWTTAESWWTDFKKQRLTNEDRLVKLWAQSA